MKTYGRKEVRTLVEVNCDFTLQSCPEVIDKGNDYIDFATVQYNGGYGSDYDLWEVDFQMHPDFLHALACHSVDPTVRNKALAYGKPKFLIQISHVPQTKNDLEGASND